MVGCKTDFLCTLQGRVAKRIRHFPIEISFYFFKICYGGDVPTCYYRKECGKVSSLKEESCQVSCVKRGTALKLNYEVKAPGSILR